MWIYIGFLILGVNIKYIVFSILCRHINMAFKELIKGSFLSLLPPVTPAATLVPFILGNIFYTIVDLTGKPAWVLQYKIQEEKAVPVG